MVLPRCSDPGLTWVDIDLYLRVISARRIDLLSVAMVSPLTCPMMEPTPYAGLVLPAPAPHLPHDGAN